MYNHTTTTTKACYYLPLTLLVINFLILCSRSPRLVDMGKVYRQTNLENLEQAFGVAERDLGVTRLLDPEGKNRR